MKKILESYKSFYIIKNEKKVVENQEIFLNVIVQYVMVDSKDKKETLLEYNKASCREPFGRRNVTERKPRDS